MEQITPPTLVFTQVVELKDDHSREGGRLQNKRCARKQIAPCTTPQGFNRQKVKREDKEYVRTPI